METPAPDTSQPKPVDAAPFRYRVTEVLDHRSQVIEKLSTRPLIMELGEKFMNIGDDQYEAGELVASEMRNSLKVSEAFHVQREMVPLVRFAAADLSPDDALRREHLPSDHGFLLFDEQVNPPNEFTFDENGWPVVIGADESPINGIMWTLKVRNQPHPWDPSQDKQVPGIWVTVLNDLRNPESPLRKAYGKFPEVLRLFEERDGRIRPSDRIHIPFGQPVGPNDLTLDDYYTMIDNSPMQAHPMEVDGDGGVPTTNRFRIVVALFRLLNQTVLVDSTRQPMPREVRRRMERNDLSSTVTSVALRRRKKTTDDPDADEAARAVEWKHQWLVRGHWAWRSCGAQHPTAEENDGGWRTYVYIAPYWKGPDDKPIHISEKVYNLMR